MKNKLKPKAGKSTSHATLQAADLTDVRDTIRKDAYTGHTAGLAGGYLQANLAIMQSEYALDFFRFCQRNPTPCPLVGVTDAGSRFMTTLGLDLAIDTDAPAYCVYRDGVLIETPTNISNLWQSDMVAFALGCSFTFENALMTAGISMRHIEQNVTVPMYRTTIELVPAGPFSGGMVVSMRPIRETDLDQITKITAQFPHAHGAPVHIGDPATIGITDVSIPDWGNGVDIREGEVPVFWACGVTPQNAAIAAKLPLFISHRPGAMLITDVDERANPPILK
jgi:uncharacterized protein YcsI (UPF0317 family)